MVNYKFAGEHWEFAIEQSQRWLGTRPVLTALLWPYLALLAVGRAAIFGSKLALASVPVRIWRDVPEVPGILYVCAFAATIALARSATYCCKSGVENHQIDICLLANAGCRTYCRWRFIRSWRTSKSSPPDAAAL